MAAAATADIAAAAATGQWGHRLVLWGGIVCPVAAVTTAVITAAAVAAAVTALLPPSLAPASATVGEDCKGFGSTASAVTIAAGTAAAAIAAAATIAVSAATATSMPFYKTPHSPLTLFAHVLPRRLIRPLLS